jgi:acid phosphatase family membrane protein YuiD
MDAFISLLLSPIFRSALFSWILAQLMKSIIELVRRRPRTLKDTLLSLVWTTGGMPSSHCAVVSSLATSIGFIVGITSPVFILSFFYAFITIRDALGVRRAAGSQAKAINQILVFLGKRSRTRIKPVKEIHGHKGPEVLVGILLGFFIAVAFCNL